MNLIQLIHIFLLTNLFLRNYEIIILKNYIILEYHFYLIYISKEKNNKKKTLKKNDKFPKLNIKEAITVFPSQEILLLNANIINE